jgi:hypothetical protein
MLTQLVQKEALTAPFRDDLANPISLTKIEAIGKVPIEENKDAKSETNCQNRQNGSQG